ncbi:His Kinase A (phospho-acceptor) domain-containing protein [Abditibacterium utsteinense]|uniref:histidine kinase n=1 Tax=Abditibacterium utsteinense TaxID=1960156 RepID=A0A2S8SVQ5_9BACT|nr:sensor histidine kinase [Abditibacterium utsteinense]PQV64886.1 His Kinase A (phospho-acceptor) domain-containing protein [Abditibacterium utsteinense]
MNASISLSRRLTKSFGVLLALLLVLVGFSILNFRVLSKASDLNTHSYQVLLETHRLSEAILMTDSGVCSFTVTGREAALGEYRRGQQLYQLHWEKLANLTSDRLSHQQRLALLKVQQRDYIEKHARPIIAARRSTPNFTRAVVAALRLAPGRYVSLRAMQQTLSEIVRVEERVRSQRSAHQENAHAWTQGTLALGALFSVLLTGGLVSVAQSASRRLDRANAQLVAEKNYIAASNARLEQINARLESEIAARAAAEEKLRRSVLELQRSNQELEQFAYVASHDLQEPLRAISGCVQVLRKRYSGKLDARGDQFIQHAVDGAQRMQSLINDLLSYSRIGTKDEDFAPAAGEEILRGALQNISMSLSESGAHFSHDALPSLICNPGQVEQVLQNLLSNALKFRGESPPRIHLGYSTKNEGQQFFHIFCVEDDGPGIEPQYFERIFVMFQRLHARATYEGTGIGLAICKKVVERHGGEIWVQSEVGRGSKFFFSIPFHPEDETSNADSGSETAS